MTSTKLSTRLLALMLAMLMTFSVVPVGALATEEPASVSLNKTELSLEVGKSDTLTLSPEGTEATWDSSSSEVATVDGGVVTAVAEGTATITATAGEHSASCEVMVTAAPDPEPVAVTGITLDQQSLELTIGGENATLTATVTPADATDKTVTWTSDNAQVATVVDGAVAPVGEGTAKITAKAGDYTAECTVTVKAKAPVAVAGITLDKETIDLTAGGGTATLTATVSPEDASGYTLVWDSDDASVATVENGVITPVGEGTALITAKAGDFFDTCEVTVTPNEDDKDNSGNDDNGDGEDDTAPLDDDGDGIIEISSYEELKAANFTQAGSYKLMTDLTLPSDWMPKNVGDYTQSPAPLVEFDGNGYTITLSGTALFDGVSGPCVVKNLTVTGTASGSGWNMGPIAVTLSGTVTNCVSYVTVANTNGGGYAGGIVGAITTTGKVENSAYLGSRITGYKTGTIASGGNSYSGTRIDNCWWTIDMEQADGNGQSGSTVTNSGKAETAEEALARIAGTYNPNPDTPAATLENIYITGFNKGAFVKISENELMYQKPITVTDLNGGEEFNLHEALVAAHKTYLTEDGYVTVYNEQYDSYGVTKLWGVDNGYGYGFFRNGKQTNAVDAEPVASGDKIVAFTYADTALSSDRLGYFTEEAKTVKAKEAFSLTLMSTHYNTSWEIVSDAVANAIIGTMDMDTGNFTPLSAVTTGENGEASITFEEPGTYYVSAQASKDDAAVLTPPVCVVTVEEAEADVTEISTAAELKAIGNGEAGKVYKLMANLTLDWNTWYMMNNNVEFAGILEGNGYTITFNANSTDPMFKTLASTGVIRNLGVVGTFNDCNAGPLAADCYGRVENCYSTATISDGYMGTSTGGLVLNLKSGGTIKNCYVNASIYGNNGIAATAEAGSTIENCYVLAPAAIAGTSNGTVTSSEAKGTDAFTDGTVADALNDGHQAGYLYWTKECGFTSTDSGDFGGGTTEPQEAPKLTGMEFFASDLDEGLSPAFAADIYEGYTVKPKAEKSSISIKVTAPEGCTVSAKYNGTTDELSTTGWDSLAGLPDEKTENIPVEITVTNTASGLSSTYELTLVYVDAPAVVKPSFTTFQPQTGWLVKDSWTHGDDFLPQEGTVYEIKPLEKYATIALKTVFDNTKYAAKAVYTDSENTEREVEITNFNANGYNVVNLDKFAKGESNLTITLTDLADANNVSTYQFKVICGEAVTGPKLTALNFYSGDLDAGLTPAFNPDVTTGYSITLKTSKSAASIQATAPEGCTVKATYTGKDADGKETQNYEVNLTGSWDTLSGFAGVYGEVPVDITVTDAAGSSTVYKLTVVHPEPPENKIHLGTFGGGLEIRDAGNVTIYQADENGNPTKNTEVSNSHKHYFAELPENVGYCRVIAYPANADAVWEFSFDDGQTWFNGVSYNLTAVPTPAVVLIRISHQDLPGQYNQFTLTLKTKGYVEPVIEGPHFKTFNVKKLTNQLSTWTNRTFQYDVKQYDLVYDGSAFISFLPVFDSEKYQASYKLNDGEVKQLKSNADTEVAMLLTTSAAEPTENTLLLTICNLDGTEPVEYVFNVIQYMAGTVLADIDIEGAEVYQADSKGEYAKNTEIAPCHFHYAAPVMRGTANITVTGLNTTSQAKLRISKDNGATWSAVSEGTLTAEVPVPNADSTVKVLIQSTLEEGNYSGSSKTENIAQYTLYLKTPLLDGSGTEEDPYILNDADDFDTLNEMVSGGETFAGQYFKVVDNVTLNDGWDGIGYAKVEVMESWGAMVPTVKEFKPFAGILDGRGNVLTFPSGSQPLFDCVRNATIKNLKISGKYIADDGLIANYATDGTYATANISGVTILSGTKIAGSGLIGGYASGSNVVTISDCHVQSGVTVGCNGDQSNIGGIAGDFNGTISGSTCAATVKGVNFVGGIVAGQGQSMSNTVISGCTFSGSVQASGNYVGGISGCGYTGTGWGFSSNAGCIDIKNCTVTGSVTGGDYVGGILGAEPGVVQCWSNGSGEISGNTFTGTLSPSGQYAGGIIGYMKSLNKFNIISNNAYSGAAKGIGGVTYVDTNHKNPTAVQGTTYVDTSKSIPNITGFGSNKSNHNREDDPLGVDASTLARLLTAAPTPVKLEISGDYKDKYEPDEKLDLTGMVIKLVWSDDTKEKISIEKVEITGYDKTELGEQELTVTYKTEDGKTVTGKFTVLVEAKGEITVYFSLLGDKNHGKTDEPHTLRYGGLQTWIGRTEYIVDANSTVYDVFKLALADNGYSYSGGGNYVSAVGGLAEFSNGPKSGWMYTLNGAHPDVGMTSQHLKDDDVILFHYTDNYDWEYGNKEDDGGAEEVINLIKAIGTVTFTPECKQKIDAARKAYDALTYSEKKKVTNLSVLEAAEKKYEELKKEDDLKKAKEVDELIEKITTPITEDSEAAITAARAAYDALTDDQKALVKNLKKLTDAEADFAALSATEEDKEKAKAVMEMIDKLGEITLESENQIKKAREAYDKLTDLQKKLVKNYDVLEAAEKELERLKNQGKYEDAFITTGAMLEKLPHAAGSEWVVLGLARSGGEVNERYTELVTAYIRENVDENNRLHRSKSTENARMILALTAMGVDATNVDGIDLVAGLNDMEYVQKQGLNGPIWALIALDSGNYPDPKGGDVTREALIDVILAAQCEDGGWTLAGDLADPDMTGMALQALAPYYDTDEEVKLAVDTAIEILSLMQNTDGSFSTGGTATSESISQVIVALTALGINPDTDERFIKNGNSALDALLAFYVKGGGFKHLLSGKVNDIATEQAFYALTAYERFLKGETRLYDMTDIFNKANAAPVEKVTASAAPEQVILEPEEPAKAPAPAEAEEDSIVAVWFFSCMDWLMSLFRK